MLKVSYQKMTDIFFFSLLFLPEKCPHPPSPNRALHFKGVSLKDKTKFIGMSSVHIFIDHAKPWPLPLTWLFQDTRNWLIFFLFSQKNRLWHFMLIVSLWDSLHEMSMSVFLWQIRTIFQNVIYWNFYPACRTLNETKCDKLIKRIKFAVFLLTQHKMMYVPLWK